MMYGAPNFNYQMQQSPYPMMQPNYGGYPTGYPPVMPQMGYGQPQMMSGYGNNIIPSMPVQQPYYPQQPQYQQFVQQQPSKNVEAPNIPDYNPDWEFDPLKYGMEVTFKDGTTQIIPPREPVPQPPQYNTNQYTQGGSRISSGGYNPVNGVTTPPVATTGFNPYGGYMAPGMMGMPMQQQRSSMQPSLSEISAMITQSQSGPVPNISQFVGNPSYQYQNTEPQRMPNPSNFGMGFAPYSPPGVDPYAFHQPWEQVANNFSRPPVMGIGYNGYQGQNQFNTTFQDFLYEDQPSCMDAREMLAGIVLSDEERAKIGQNNVTYDYFGRPNYYANYYKRMQQEQEAAEAARYNYQAHFTNLSKIAHAYSGEKIDEAAMMKRFDPVPPPPPAPKIFDYATATPAERIDFAKNQRVNDTMALANYVDYLENYGIANETNYKNYLFSQIKASHDKLIGVQPGQHYDLKTYMDNGYKIGVAIKMDEAKRANRNGLRKYSRRAFRQYMNENMEPGRRPVPVPTTDDEFISLKDMVQRAYAHNLHKKDKMAVDRVSPTENGQEQVVTSAPVVPGNVQEIDRLLDYDDPNYDRRVAFYNEMLKRKETNDAMRAVDGYV